MRCGLDKAHPTAYNGDEECWRSRSACFGRFHEAQSLTSGFPVRGH